MSHQARPAMDGSRRNRRVFAPKDETALSTKTTEYLEIFSLASAHILFFAYIFVKTFFILMSRSNFRKNRCQKLFNKDTEGKD